MAHNLSKIKFDAKGNEKAISSATAAENPFTLVSTKSNKDFQIKHQNRLVIN